MKTKPNHIVLTTIFDPIMLDVLYENLLEFEHLHDTKIWVIGDTKTPKECGERCKKNSDRGMDVIYVDILAQNEWGKRFEALYARIPFANETRRNIGYLMALENGCERLISMDDDNFPCNGDNLISGHSGTGSRLSGETIKENCGFHNLCEYLELEPNRHIYPRGYPFALRGGNIKNIPQSCSAPKNAKIGVTAGLWVNEPDIDAVTWLNGRIIGKRYKGPNKLVLSQDTWTPINTQNTSVARELIPAYLCIPMGVPVPGGKIQRYGDIWGGYFLQSVLKGTDWFVSFGSPIVDHRRNPHDYIDDLRCEFWGMILTDWLLDKLKNSFTPTSDTICERVIELSEFIHKEVQNGLPDWCPNEVKQFMEDTCETMKLWSLACGKFL